MTREAALRALGASRARWEVVAMASGNGMDTL